MIGSISSSLAKRVGALLLFAMVGAPVLAVAKPRLIYFPRPYSAEERAEFRKVGLLEIKFETGQGTQVAFYKKSVKALPERVWLVFGGNGARATNYRDIAKDARDGYLFVDYPGYGSCEGKPSPRAIDASYTGAVAALSVELGTEAGELEARLCSFGHSLGCAVALRAAVKFEMSEVVMVSPFTSMKEMAQLAVGKLLANVLLHRYDNRKRFADLVEENPDVRVVIVHGTADAMVPVEMGRELAAQQAENVTLFAIEGGDHNRIVSTARKEILRAMKGVGEIGE